MLKKRCSPLQASRHKRCLTERNFSKESSIYFFLHLFPFRHRGSAATDNCYHCTLKETDDVQWLYCIVLNLTTPLVWRQTVSKSVSFSSQNTDKTSVILNSLVLSQHQDEKKRMCFLSTRPALVISCMCSTPLLFWNFSGSVWRRHWPVWDFDGRISTGYFDEVYCYLFHSHTVCQITTRYQTLFIWFHPSCCLNWFLNCQNM